MTRIAATFILIGTLGAAASLFYLGLELATGENDHVYWEIRGPLWAFAGIAVLLGCFAAWLALRSERS